MAESGIGGRWRVEGRRAAKTKPDYLRRCHSPTLLSAKFYTEAADRQYREEKFEWGCLAGEQFFDIEPDGDLWLCQDKPSEVELNSIRTSLNGESI